MTVDARESNGEFMARGIERLRQKPESSSDEKVEQVKKPIKGRKRAQARLTTQSPTDQQQLTLSSKQFAR